MNHIFIINPAAGGGRGYKYVPFIESLAKEHGELLKKNYEIELTSRPGDATSMGKSTLTRVTVECTRLAVMVLSMKY